MNGSNTLHQPVKCHRHETNNFTHYSPSANKMLCLSCFQAKESDRQSKLIDLIEIESYTKTFEFKQRTTKLQEDTRRVGIKCKSILGHYGQMKDMLEDKRHVLVTEVKHLFSPQ